MGSQFWLTEHRSISGHMAAAGLASRGDQIGWPVGHSIASFSGVALAKSDQGGSVSSHHPPRPAEDL